MVFHYYATTGDVCEHCGEPVCYQVVKSGTPISCKARHAQAALPPWRWRQLRSRHSLISTRRSTKCDRRCRAPHAWCRFLTQPVH